MTDYVDTLKKRNDSYEKRIKAIRDSLSVLKNQVTSNSKKFNKFSKSKINTIEKFPDLEAADKQLKGTYSTLLSNISSIEKIIAPEPVYKLLESIIYLENNKGKK